MAAQAETPLPVDPWICLAPVESGDPGAPPYAMPSSRHRPFFIPGHPTPVLYGVDRADYFDGEGRLRRHPLEGEPDYLRKFFLGGDGEVYWWVSALPDDPRFVFDRGLGHFRPIRPDETERHARIEGFLAEIAAVPRPFDAPSRISPGGISSVRSRDSGLDSDDQGYMTQARSAETPHFGLRVETEGDRLRLTRGGRSRELVLPSVGYGSWKLTELMASGRVLFQNWFGEQFFLIDEDLELTRPDGDWRLGERPEAIYLPETGEALVTTLAAFHYHNALLWLRDRRISGPDICGDLTPPPVQGFRITEPAGAGQIDTAHMTADVTPDWNGAVFTVRAANGTFEITLDGQVTQLDDRPRTRSDQRGWFDWFGDSPAPTDSVPDWPAWLETSPNPERWSGAEAGSDGEPLRDDQKPRWWKLPRFGFAIRQDGKGRFVRMGPDLAPVMAPGQPENPYWSLDGMGPVFDPGVGDILAVDARNRIVLIAPDGGVRRADCAAPCALGWITGVDADPTNPAGALIGAEGGLLRYTPGAPIERVAPIGQTGTVLRIQTVHALGEVLIEAGFGRFVWSEERGLRRLGRSGGASHPLRLFEVPGTGQVFTATRIPARFELTDEEGDGG